MGFFFGVGICLFVCLISINKREREREGFKYINAREEIGNGNCISNKIVLQGFAKIGEAHSFKLLHNYGTVALDPTNCHPANIYNANHRELSKIIN